MNESQTPTNNPAEKSDAMVNTGANSRPALDLDIAAAVLDTAGALVIVLEPSGDVVHMNRFCEQISGYTLSEVRGKAFWEIFATVEERETTQREFEALRDGVTRAQCEHDFLSRGGSRHHITWSNTTLTNALGEVEHLIATGIDITELRDAEAACQASDAFNQSIIDNSPDCIKILDLDGRLQFISEGGIHLLEIRDSSRYINMPYESFWKGSDRDATRDAIATARQGGVGRFRGYCPTESGTPKWWDVVISPILGAEGSVDRLLAVSRDITEQRDAEVALRDSQAKMEALFELLPIGISVLDSGRRVVRDNAALHHILQLSRDDLQSGAHTHRTYLRADGSAMPPEEFPTARAFATQQPAHAQVGIVTRRGATIWTDVSAAPVPFSDWKVVAATSDITELIEAHEALRLSNEILEQRVAERTRSLEASNQQLTGEVEERLRVEQALRQHEASLEKHVEERTRDLSTLLQISNAVALSQKLEPLLQQILELLSAVVRYDGATVYCLREDGLHALLHRGPLQFGDLERLHLPINRSSLAYQLLAQQQPIVIADVHDDTPAARALREVTGTQIETTFGYVRAWLGLPLTVKDQVVGVLTLQRREVCPFDARETSLAQAFAGQVAIALETARLHRQEQELAALEERQHLARELHDAVSQTLFSASLAAEVLPRLWEKDHELGLQCLSEVRQWTRGALAEMRTLLLELRPTSLLQTDLTALLAQLAEAASSRARVDITVATPPLCPLPAEVQVTFYRIAQEALNNMAKHAGASQATITLRCSVTPESSPQAFAQWAELSVADNGRGFDPDGAWCDGARMGLSIMQERARAVGTNLHIESAPGNGTRITVAWQERTEP